MDCISFSPGDLPRPRIKGASPALAGRFFTAETPGKPSNCFQFSLSVVSDSLWPHESQYARPPCPSPTPRIYSNSCPLSRWCHPAISSSVVPFFSCPQSLPASGSFPMSRLFAWGGQRTGVSASASVLPMNTQDWFPLGCTGWISLQSKGLSRVFSNTTVQKQVTVLQVIYSLKPHFIHQRHCCKYIKYINSFNVHDSQIILMLLLPPFYRWLNWEWKEFI